MSRTVRRFALAAVLTVVIVVAGTIGGFFDIFDLINRVQVSEVENELGGYTFTKVTMEDKVVSWPETYLEDFMPTIDGEKAYMWSEKTDAENYIIDYMMIYKSDKSVEEVTKFYADYYADAEVNDLDKFISVNAYHDYYLISVSIEEDGDQTEVSVRAVYPEE